MRLLFLATTTLSISVSVFSATPFDEQRNAVSSSITTQPEEAIVSLLKAGLAEKKFSQAYGVTKGWFQQNQPNRRETLLLGAQAAFNWSP